MATILSIVIIILGMDTNATTTLLVLTAKNPRQCINVSLISDGLIEETEAVTLTLKLTDNVLGIGSVAQNVTVITIVDQDSKFVLVYL